MFFRKMVRLRQVPTGSEGVLRSALEKSGVLEGGLLSKLQGISFGDGSGKTPTSYLRSALLEFETDEDATLALRAIRKRGLTVEGRSVTAHSRIAKAFTEASEREWQRRREVEMKEDPIGEWSRYVEEQAMEMPTLEQIRDVVLDEDVDQHEFLRFSKMPGLTKPEWLEEDAAAEAAENEDDPDADDDYFGSRTREAVPHPSDVLGKFGELVVKVDRVQKVVRGGNVTKFRALVCCGNLMGAGGFAYGKGATPQEAVARASHKSKKNLHFVERFKNVALAHDVKGKHNNCIVKIFATPPGYGTKGSALGRNIMKLLGFSSFTIKAHGRRTPPSYVRATFDALSQLESVEEIARRRGRRLMEIEKKLLSGRRWPVNYRKYD